MLINSQASVIIATVGSVHNDHLQAENVYEYYRNQARGNQRTLILNDEFEYLQYETEMVSGLDHDDWGMIGGFSDQLNMKEQWQQTPQDPQNPPISSFLDY